MECDICKKVLSRKQTLISHKVTHHGIQPDYQIKRYKMYMKDPTVKIPRSTAFRKCNSKAYAEKSFNNTQNVCNSRHFGTVNMSPSCGSLNDQDDRNTCTGSVETSCNLQDENCSNTGNEISILQLEHNLETNSTKTCQVRNVDLNETVHLQQQCSLLCVDSSNNETIVHPSTWDSDSSSASTCRSFDLDSSNDASVYTGTSSDSDESNIYADTGSEKSFTSESEDEIDFDMLDQNNSKNTFTEDLSNEDEKSMAILAYMLRYHSSGNACRDLVKIINILNPKCKVKDINKLKEVVGSTDYQIIHFCEKCFTLFPDDDAVFQCSLIGCDGLRYKGSINKQSLKRRKSFFTCMSVCQQIKGILERDGIWSALSKYRADCAATKNITDILNADAYRELQKEGNFMHLNDNITLLFNTDGVPLFKSSGVSIWPVYLVINELPPSMRFSRRNMILWGIWQAKGKPVFRAFLQPFVEHMRQLKQDGLTITVGAETIKTKVLLFASTMDLQAKAYLAETTQHNGKYGCITCEEPGEVVGQGRGHTRVYPYRPNTELYKERTTSEILMCGLAAVDTGKPELGIKGVSALHGLEWFDIVWGLVPDYMHGVLLGVGKMMLRLWFSSSSSGKPYFIGKSIKQVDRYLKRMKPTDDVTRLPRKIEKNMHHFKASEIQMWLLFYAIPCLIEIMDPEYLEHFCYLVEGIYILLGDQISMERLKHAEHVLNIYYEKFSSLYGQNNCTLNLHNVCRHLPQYVKKLGPLWAWSCFAFEDMNGSVGICAWYWRCVLSNFMDNSSKEAFDC